MGNRTVLLDNQWIVPYNKFLCAKYNCHINVEICASIKAIKYLFKYVYKGHDKATIEITGEHQDHETEAKPIVIDEIHNFIEACWVSAPEAIWRILGFNVSGINPAVTHLQVHLPNQQRVIFNEDVNLVVVATSRIQQTSLTEYFKMNNQDPDARNLLYSDFPMYYTWNKATKSLKKRQHGGCIGRIYMAHPSEGE
ncbi:11459_t:CDS:1 [Entrophospora sp. SA101]|nr:11459_t:CDS:1 [Entrophospora sp. SA101]